MILSILTALAVAASAGERIDDSEFSSPAISIHAEAILPLEGHAIDEALVFPLTARGANKAAAPGTIAGRLVLVDRDRAARPARLAKARLVGQGAPAGWTSVRNDGSFVLTGARDGFSYKIRVSLNNPRWNFVNSDGKTYEWETADVASGSDAGTLSPGVGTENEKLGVLHLTYLDALDFLSREATAAWWKKSLTVIWPDQSDYFTPHNWTLHLTNAMAWDVNLHELGHAVMHGAMAARSAGGAHKIDECYTPELAWSEGWATFFAGAVKLSPDDADAKFEFLVPRRAPIRIENVPADVCREPKNEWRVAAGLWDLYDRHEDAGDRIALPFTQIWTGIVSGKTGSIGDAWALIAKITPQSRRAGEDALIANFLLPTRSNDPRVALIPTSTNTFFDGRP
jgi:hypothetical protein